MYEFSIKKEPQVRNQQKDFKSSYRNLRENEKVKELFQRNLRVQWDFFSFS